MNEHDAHNFPDPADLPAGPLICLSPRPKPRRRRRGWRWPVLLSLLGHVAAVALFWAFSDKLVRMPDIAALSPDTQACPAEEEEQDYLVMDVGMPAPRPPQVPTVEAPARHDDPAVADPPVVQAARLHEVEAPIGHDGAAIAAAQPRAGEPPALRAGPAGLPLFVPTAARSVVYVIDRSGSMGTGGRLALARRELLASLDGLPPGASFQIIPYNRVAEPLRIAGQTVLVPATPANKQQAALLLEALAPEGGTDHLAALQRALLLQPEAIYFLTDADDLEAAQVQRLTRLNHGRTIIHTIELTARHRDTPGMPLQALAHDNRGEYRGVDVGQ